LLIAEGHGSGAPILKRALSKARRGAERVEDLRWLTTACTVSGLLWDYESWDALSDRLVRLAREAGALESLPIGLNTRAGAYLLGGDLFAAASLVEEARTINAATGSSIAPYGELTLLAFEGRAAEASELIAATTTEALQRGEGHALTFVHWATAVLQNAFGRYQDALAAAGQAAEDSNASWFYSWGLVELIEAATRCGELPRAADAMARLSAITTASGTDWGLGVEARSRALLAAGTDDEGLYQEAIERLGRTRVRTDLARAHLLYGEWLRRERRRLDAREQLRRAHAMFTEFRMSAFAERARVELEATGEHARARTVTTRDELTPQETQISRLAADGATNQEIAARLFISPSTVDYHLRKAFRKLGVRSRTQLAPLLLRAGAGSGAPARKP
jgi:DNA-binding CsgD family transcriptional regulator